MTKSNETRQIVRRMIEMGFAISDVAEATNTSRSTVYRWQSKGWERTVETTRQRKLTFEQERRLCQRMCDDRPCLLQQDLVELGKTIMNTTISQSYVSRMLRRHDITRKRSTKRYDQQDPVKVAAFKSALPLDAHTTWWSMDECGFLFNQAPSYAYSPRGQRAIVSRPGPRGKRVSLMLCISPQGCIGHTWLWGGVKSVHFREFLDSLPGEGVMVLDNASIHKVSSPRHRLVFLPPYSPQLNPVEMCFNVLKAAVRRACIRTFDDLKVCVERSLSALDMRGFFASCWSRTGPNLYTGPTNQQVHGDI